MLPAATKLLKVLGVLMFGFSTLGVSMFGGLIRTDDPRLEDSLYGRDRYCTRACPPSASGNRLRN